MIDALSVFNLKQYNYVLNNNGRILDLILCDKSLISSLRHSDVPLVGEDLYHPSLEFLLELPSLVKTLCSPNNYCLNFNKADYMQINRELVDVNWDQIFNDRALDDCVDLFYNYILNSINKFVPKFYVNKKFPQYFSSRTIRIIKQKNKIHKKWKLYKNESDYNLFKILRNQSKDLIKTDFKNYISSLESKLATSPKQFWKYASIKRQFSSEIPTEMCLEQEISRGGQEVCDLFAQYFSSVFVNADTSGDLRSDPNSVSSHCSLGVLSLGQGEVLSYLLGVDTCKTAGADNIPPIFIKSCADSLCKPLTFLFNKSLQEGSFPHRWKVSTVLPIFKNGQKNDVKNYRPICKLSTIPKLFEKIIYKSIWYLVKNLIKPEQHGFFQGRSLESNLLVYSEYLHGALDNGVQVDAVYTDFSKAFDKVNHNILLLRLAEVGVTGSLLRWVESYLCNRSQIVSVQGYKSFAYVATSGVPQGSHLGPLLFIIYINSIDSCFLNSKYLLYADDMKIFKEIHSLHDCVALQEDLNRFAIFCNRSSLFLNLSKCCFITFTRNKNVFLCNYVLQGENLTRATNVKDLGITFDSKLMFHLHIDSMINSCSRMLGFVFRSCKLLNNPKSLLSIFNSYILSRLCFGSVIWSPQYQYYINRIEKIQIKFIKYICFKTNFEYNSDNLALARSHFGLISLVNRRTVSDLLFLHKILNGSLDNPPILGMFALNIPRADLRNFELFHQPFRNTNCSFNSPLCRMVRRINKHPEIDLFDLTYLQTKKKLKLLFSNM